MNKLFLFLLLCCFCLNAWALGIDDSTTAIIHFNGTDNSTTIVESSNTTHTYTAQGNAKLRTLSPKFGTANLYLDGAGDYVNASDSTSWDFVASTNENYTLEAWVNGTQVSENPLFEHYQDTNNYWSISLDQSAPPGSTSDTIRLLAYNGGGIILNKVWTGQRINTTQWVHVEVAKICNGGAVTYRAFVNGVVDGTDYADNDVKAYAGDFRIGDRDTGAAYFAGGIDEVRISKFAVGTPPRHVANFTPSAVEFGMDAAVLNNSRVIMVY